MPDGTVARSPYGHVRETSPGRWQLSVSAGRDPLTRKPRRLSRTVDAATADEARARLAELRDEVNGDERQAAQLVARRKAARRLNRALKAEGYWLNDPERVLGPVLEAWSECIDDAAQPLEHAASRVAAKAAADSFDPTGYFVYCLWGDDPDVPLYVGQSTNVFGRLGSHFQDATKRPSIRRVSLVRCADKETMDLTELQLIRQHRPEWNIRGVN